MITWIFMIFLLEKLKKQYSLSFFLEFDGLKLHSEFQQVMTNIKYSIEQEISGSDVSIISVAESDSYNFLFHIK